jgi:hypothetical protein
MMLLKKYILVIFLMSSVILPACDNKQANPVDTYVGAVNNAGNVAGAANLVTIRQSVEAYHAANGKYPASLGDIEGMMGSQIDVAKFDYNPETGAVTLKAQP